MIRTRRSWTITLGAALLLLLPGCDAQTIYSPRTPREVRRGELGVEVTRIRFDRHYAGLSEMYITLAIRAPRSVEVAAVNLSSAFERSCNAHNPLTIGRRWQGRHKRLLTVALDPELWSAFEGPVVLHVSFKHRDGCIQVPLNGRDGSSPAWRISDGGWSSTFLARVAAPPDKAGVQSFSVVPELGHFIGPLWVQAGAGPSLVTCARDACVDKQGHGSGGPGVAYSASADLVLWASARGTEGFIGPRYQLLLTHVPVPGDDPLRTVHAATLGFTLGMGTPPLQPGGLPGAPGAFSGFQVGFGVQHESTRRSSLTVPLVTVGYVLSIAPSVSRP